MKPSENSNSKVHGSSPDHMSKVSLPGAKNNELQKPSHIKGSSGAKLPSNDNFRATVQGRLHAHAKPAFPVLGETQKLSKTIGSFKTIKIMTKRKSKLIDHVEAEQKEETESKNVFQRHGPARVLLQKQRSKTSSLERKQSEQIAGGSKCDALIGVKTFGDRKEAANLVKWYEIGCKQIQSNQKYTQEQKFEYLQNIFKMALESIVEGSNEEFPENEERMRMVTRVWNDNAESLQEYIKSLLIQKEEETNIEGKSKELERKMSLLQGELRQSYESILALQKEKADLIKKLEKFKEEMKHKNIDVEKFLSYNNWTVPRLEAPSGNAIIKNRIDKLLMKESMAVDTSDIVQKFEKGVWANPLTQVREKFTQTDLLDFVTEINNFDISPRKTPSIIGKGTSPFKMRIRQIFFDEDVIQEIDTATQKSDLTKGKIFNFKSIENSNDLPKDEGPLAKLNMEEVCGNFESGMDDFFVKVESIMSKIRDKSICINDIENMPDEVNNRKSFTRDLMGLIVRREKDSWFQIMNHKITIAERELELKDKEKTIENWQRRFNILFQKNQRTLEILLHENLNTSELRKTVDDLKITRKGDYLKDVYYEEQSGKKGNKATGAGTPASRSGPRRISLKLKQTTQMAITSLNTSKSISKLPEFGAQLGAQKDSGSENESGPNKNTETLIPVNRFNLQKIFKNVVTVNGNAAIKFIQRLKQVPLKPKEDIKLDLALKIIAAVYTEVFKQGDRRENHNPLYFFVFDYLTNRYGGLQRSAESKMIALIRTCLKFQENIKLRLFLKLMTIIEHEPYEMDGWDLNFYLDSLIKLDDDSQGFKGLALTMNSREKTLVPLKNAIEYVTDFYSHEPEISKVMSPDSLLNTIKQNKITDESIMGRWLIEADFAINLVLQSRYDYLVSRYKTVFDALDCEKREYIDLEQFLLLWRNLKISTYNYDKAKQLFKQEADLMDKETNRVNLSFKQFATLLEKQELFSFNDFTSFSRSRDHYIQNVLNLEANWPLKKSFIKLKFIKIRMYNIYFQKMMKSIEDYFFESERDDGESIWLRYRLVDDESTSGYAESMIEEVLEKRLMDLTEAFDVLKTKKGR